jgi:predicted PurR-regulated permease PerM
MDKALTVADTLARSNDRFAFFVALIVLGGLLGGVGVWALRYLVNQNRELVKALTDSHIAFQTELKGIVSTTNGALNANAVAHAAQAEQLRENSEVLRDARLALERNRQAAHA